MRNFDEEGEYANLAGIGAKLWRESAPAKYYVEPAPRAAAGRPCPVCMEPALAADSGPPIQNNKSK